MWPIFFKNFQNLKPQSQTPYKRMEPCFDAYLPLFQYRVWCWRLSESQAFYLCPAQSLLGPQCGEHFHYPHLQREKAEKGKQK